MSAEARKERARLAFELFIVAVAMSLATMIPQSVVGWVALMFAALGWAVLARNPWTRAKQKDASANVADR